MKQDILPFRYVGRPLKYTPEQLLEEFKKYVDWCTEHPLKDNTFTEYKQGYSDQTTTKPRRISIDGFLVYLGVLDSWWSQLEKGKRREEFSRVKEAIRMYCESYQKDMASAGLLNANIISRLLGLADKQAHDVNTKEGFTLVVSKDAAELLNNGK